VSHAVISNFLKQGRITPRQVWELVKNLLNNTEESCPIVDDSVQNKQYSKAIERVKRQYSGTVGGLVRGIGVVNLVHTDDKDHYPIDYRTLPMKPMEKPKTTTSRKCSSTPLPTNKSRQKPCCLIAGMRRGRI
jgi:SRSO17 transposase